MSVHMHVFVILTYNANINHRSSSKTFLSLDVVCLQFRYNV